MTADIEVQRVSACAGVPDDEAIERWARQALAGRAPRVRLTIRIVDADEARSLNRRYRGRDAATNILSFEAGLPAGLESEWADSDRPVPLGDLVICAPVVAEEAARQGKRELHHWAHLTVHGILHLLGYTHDAAAPAEAMERLERELLEELGVPDPYAPR